MKKHTPYLNYLLVIFVILFAVSDSFSQNIVPNPDFETFSSPQADVNMTWQDGSHASSITADQQQPYSLQVSNSCGNKADSLNVLIDDRTPVINIDTSMSWCEGDVIILDATQSFDAD